VNSTAQRSDSTATTMSIERTDAAFRAWLSKHMPAALATDMSSEELAIVAHTLVYSEQFEEYVHLHLKSGAVVISLDRDRADEAILQHYAEKGVREYRKYVSDEKLPGYELPLLITKLVFISASDASVVMAAGLADKLIKAAEVDDAVQYEFVPQGEGKTQLCFAWKNPQKRFFLYRIACTCRRHDLKMAELHFQYLNVLTAKCILVGTIMLEGPNVKDTVEMKRFMREFEMLKTFRGFDPLLALVESKTITGNQANLLRALTALIEQALTEVNSAMYTEESIMEAFCFHPELTVDFINVFKAKFHPKVHDLAKYETLKKALEEKLKKLDTGRKKHDDRRRAVFTQALNITQHILRTNCYSYRKLGIGFRIDPHYLDFIPGFDRKSKFPEIPFSLFFVRGGSYMGMQIRFRDLARGGMRTVVAWDEEHERYERPNMFTECYNLAFTQQKKNKDIPEGGSKAILFLNANTELAFELALARKEMLASGKPAAEVDVTIAKLEKDMRFEYMYQNQRCFLTTFLTLFIWDFEKNCLKYNENVVDYLNIPEYIYLGPDENFHDALIQWLAAKSTAMGYYAGGAFISGKEDTGVNHKEYGVTSWGVLQFLHHAVKFVGLDKFTVKLTGGPDGDVAGNMILLLKKYYPTRAKLVLVTDGSGTCYDPEGFDLETLEHMFHKVQMMEAYPPEKLHEGAWILCIKTTRQATSLSKEVLVIRKKDGKVVQDWISSNAAFHLYGSNAHTTVADVFLPCGGRPRALNATNLQDFYVDGKPSCKIICEGANLYITQDAREKLEDDGVILFRDSSANKCGVVSSSYEILAGLSMTDEQFVKVKPELARNILARLEKIANDEARCMLEYFVANGRKVRLTAISELVSKKINQYTDEMAAYLAPLDLSKPENKKLFDIFVNYIPECIRRDYLQQAIRRVPDMHKKAIISTHIACMLVYGKGLAWAPSVPDLLPTLLQ